MHLKNKLKCRWWQLHFKLHKAIDFLFRFYFSAGITSLTFVHLYLLYSNTDVTWPTQVLFKLIIRLNA